MKKAIEAGIAFCEKKQKSRKKIINKSDIRRANRWSEHEMLLKEMLKNV